MKSLSKLFEVFCGELGTSADTQSSIYIGESSNFPKSLTFVIQILKLAVCLQSVNNFEFKWSIAQG